MSDPALRPSRDAIAAAASIVQEAMAPTPQQCWPLLSERLGAETWVKHENHTPVGAFKVRGGLVYFDALARSGRQVRGVICATRGNHGQSVAFAAGRYGIDAKIVVPCGNSREKNAAMRGLGATLVEYGHDFQAAREHAEGLAREQALEIVPSFHPLLVTGVATYAVEFLEAAPELDVVYVPIGLGSGICGMLAARDALGLRTEVVGVVSAHATAYAESFAAGAPVESPVSTRLADGMACRVVEPAALELILGGVERIVEVTDDEIAAAMRVLFECTHNIAEGAGAAAAAAALQEARRNAGRRIGIVLSGANVDRELFAGVLAEQTYPQA
ncbi:MAG TPA: threonine dehydratase [Gammaproteobacteria bacterium]|nr:threonine dehydratase [Gammaproteobacteria bacterium]